MLRVHGEPVGRYRSLMTICEVEELKRIDGTAVHLVDVIEKQAYCDAETRRSDDVIRSFRAFPSTPTTTRAEIVDMVWPREQLLQLAYLLDHLAPPDHHNPERYYEQKSALAHELRRLARWARHST